jgi:hypothetical protein
MISATQKQRRGIPSDIAHRQIAVIFDMREKPVCSILIKAIRYDQYRPKFDHVTLARGAAGLAVVTNTLAVPFRPEASSRPTRLWAGCAGSSMSR